MKARFFRRYQKAVALFIMLGLLSSMASAAGESPAPDAAPVAVAQSR